MKRLTAENIVDAYDWSATLVMEVSRESQPVVDKDIVYNLNNVLREYLLLLLTDERNGVDE